ncbi:MAG TPA: PPE domain-containing protein [Actinophytocola sp.]|uniref:PPE domain-containing protein n=1 Tax=Actinophytocola sp. TaxID=1872138 RepID=UPI002DBA6F15|nr:PPE domain-containing protein [Actinophytocola sp.]HEU5475791.1 PPE domain-containing protein [Actinophytocola sp.]
MAEQTADATRWQGFTHQELYKLLHEGAGPGASADASRRWSEIAATLTEVGEDLQSAIDRTGAGWNGRAAGQAYDALAVLVDWAHRTAGQAGEMRELVDVQADALARARADMPVPEDVPPTAPDPATAPAVQVIATQTDQEPVETAATAGQQKAFEVMTNYQRSSQINTDTMAAFSPPAAVVVDTGELNRHRGSGVVLTTPAAAITTGLAPGAGVGPAVVPAGAGGNPHREPHFNWGTSGAAAEATPMRPGPGTYTGAAGPNAPMFGPTFVGGGGGRFSSGSGRTGTGTSYGTGTTYGTGSGHTNSYGSGTGYGPGPGGAHGPGSGPGAVPPGSGAGSGSGSGSGAPTGPRAGAPVPTAGSSIGAGFTGLGGGITGPDMQSAAAGQMAAAAGTPAAATPGAAAGPGHPQDKPMLRRFGSEVIGSAPWFDDTPDNEVRGATPGRRHRTTDERVTESVSIDGEEHNLPPTVIGDTPH